MFQVFFLKLIQNKQHQSETAKIDSLIEEQNEVIAAREAHLLLAQVREIKLIYFILIYFICRLLFIIWIKKERSRKKLINFCAFFAGELFEEKQEVSGK